MLWTAPAPSGIVLASLLAERTEYAVPSDRSGHHSRAGRVVADYDIDGQAVELVDESGSFALRGSEGRVELTTREAIALRDRPDELVALLRASGMSAMASSASSTPRPRPLENTLHRLWNDIGGAPLAVVGEAHAPAPRKASSM
jgi:hypothetical protein